MNNPRVNYIKDNNNFVNPVLCKDRQTCSNRTTKIKDEYSCQVCIRNNYFPHYFPTLHYYDYYKEN